MNSNEIRAAVVDALGQRSRPVDGLAAELAALGIDPAIDPEELEELLEHDPAFTHTTAGWFYVPAMVDGVAWTVPVDSDRAADDHLQVEPWLAPIAWWLVSEDIELVDRTGHDGSLDMHSEWDDEAWAEGDVLCGPDGWLTELAGGTAAFSVRDRRVQLTPCPETPVPSPGQLEAVRTAFNRVVQQPDADATFDGRPVDRRFVSISTVMSEALAAARSTFVDAPVPMLPQLIEEAGLEVDRGWVAAAGFDWQTLRQWQATNRLVLLHDLDQQQAELAASLVGAALLAADGDPDALGTSDAERRGAAELLGAALDIGPVAEAFWGDLDRRRELDAVEPFAAALALHRDPEASIGTTWLQARTVERAGDGAKAAAILDRHLTPTVSHRPALIDLAAYAADRSDLTTAHRLITRARASLGHDRHLGEQGERLAEEVNGYRTLQPRKLARRNDPCPCGSGRKYKACHAGRDELPIEHRAAWLFEKAVRYLLATDPDLPWVIAQSIVVDPDDTAAVEVWFDSPIVADIALHEGGWLGAFAAARHGLLPADEAELVEAWLEVDRGLFEIQAVHGGTVELYDVNRDESCRVENVHRAVDLGRGLLLGRPLPVGQTLRAFSGFLPVPFALARAVSDALDEGTPTAVADTIGEVVAFA